MSNHIDVKLKFSEKAYSRLSMLKENAGISADSEVIRRALRLYEWHLQKKNDGYSFIVSKDDEANSIDFCGLF